jgi:trans-2,3-dihydro-3-hydroxyanthranilate isomerase
MAYKFTVVDVFADRPFAGNQLAVLTDARGLDTAACQAIAREFNFAETSFVFPPENPANTARVRIFTPAYEMPFAGHPNVGTAFVLGLAGGADAMRFEEIAGIVECEVLRDGAAVTGARVRAPASLVVREPQPAAVAARLAGLEPHDIVATTHGPVVASVGAPFLFAEVSPEALAHAAVTIAPLPPDTVGVAIYARTGPAAVEVRMFAPDGGVPEDPATGSAAAALGALLHHHDPAATSLAVSQGRFVGRPSRIDVTVGSDGVRIAGNCALMMRGELLA